MRRQQTRAPSFPSTEAHVPLASKAGQVWQVLCGDQDHWRAGVYSPAESRRSELRELEKHDCPELFCLLSGRLTLLVARDRSLVELPLEPLRPVLVTGPHAGFCPDGPHTGTALVVERDAFDTEYQPPEDWTQDQTMTFPAFKG